MRWSMLAALVAVIGLGLTGCSDAPTNTESTTITYEPGPQDARSDSGSCLLIEGVEHCSLVRVEIMLVGPREVTYESETLKGLTIKLTSNDKGGFTVTWKTTNKAMKILGANDGTGLGDGKEDILFQSPYEPMPGAERITLYIDTPHPNQWEQLATS